jgi:hypothetical protein
MHKWAAQQRPPFQINKPKPAAPPSAVAAEVSQLQHIQTDVGKINRRTVPPDGTSSWQRWY